MEETGPKHKECSMSMVSVRAFGFHVDTSDNFTLDKAWFTYVIMYVWVHSYDVIHKDLFSDQGNIDPWTELSVVWNDTTVDDDRVILIDGTAHCMDMNSDESVDKPALHQARKVTI